jgi:hypothetical protein
MESKKSPILSSDSESNNLPINAVFPDGSKKSYNFNSQSTVGNLVQLILSDTDIKKPKDKSICVMYHGRILKSSEKFSEIDTLPDYTVSILFRLCKSAAQAEQDQLDNGSILKGFDRLTRMNYSPEQIEEIRHQFHRMRGGLNETRDQQIDAEEEWLPVIFNSENPLETFQTADAERPIQTQNQAHHGRNNYDTFHFEQNSFWINFSIAFILGVLFGPLSALYLFVSLRDKAGIFGIIVGIGVHYLLSKVFNISLF